ncbi:hypothetical protein GOA90_25335 [Sinorhizobium meliloti]|nr:hypothetical protein [Sinorhizobium meliloti]
MREIPADIEETAYDEADVFSDWYGCDGEKRKRLTAAFENAILAERERCAKIADKAARSASASKDRKAATSLGGAAVLTGYIFAETEANAIAAAIRRGDQ